MATQRSGQITQLLSAVGRGDEVARERLWTLVYGELREIARRQMTTEAVGRTLQPTALVNEAYLRLVGEGRVDSTNRCHFFAAAAKTMRQIRVDDARKRNRVKRGGGRRRVPLQAAERARASRVAQVDDDPTRTLALDDALRRLERTDPRMADVVVLRYHGGMTRDQIAEVLSVSPRTVDNLWSFARAWLHRELSPVP